jgi:pyruvate dehydrogenase E2 component (dihydrolipoyllysine-residue acetyltransferase)
MYEFKMPSLGADMDSGKLVQWLVKPGDRVKKGDVIAVVETQKSAVDVEIWKNGIIEKLLAEPSEENIPVGRALALVKIDEAEEEESLAPPPIATPSRSAEAQRLHVSPAARKLAEQFHLDLVKVKGSGAEGAVTLADVEQAIAAQTPSMGVSPPLVADKKSAMRRAIATAMERSNREIPHYFLETTISMSRALEWMEAENLKRPPPERILYIALLLKAVALALKKVPELNGFYLNGAAQVSEAIHVGVAVSLREGGLMAPALHNTDQKTLTELMTQLQDLVQRVRTGGLRSSELTDPTITVTSLGEEGVEKVFGLIYPSQVAIVGFGKISEEAVVESKKVVSRRVIHATLSADHRVTDGHRGALFLNSLGGLLQEPEKL